MPPSRASLQVRSLVLAAGLGLLAGCQPKPPPPAPAPPPVEVAPVIQRDEPIRQEWIGTLDGLVDAQIRAQVTGYLRRQDYHDGAPVKKGQLLFEIDPRPFQAAYDQLKADFDKAELDLKRARELLASQAAAQEQYDDALQADLAAKAALEQAQLNLGFTRITSPIDGIAAIATAQIGDLVSPGSGILTTVSTVDPIKAYFSITEQTYLELAGRHPGAGGLLDGDELDLTLSDGSLYPWKGRFFAADREVAVDTGTLRVAATFPNPGYLLRPGQYARVSAVIRIERGALLVPQQAVSELQGGYQIAVIDAENRAEIRNVEMGDRVGPLWIVRRGLHPGERVVIEGGQKVREGGLVEPHPASVDPAGR